jgi:hypothetical protein
MGSVNNSKVRKPGGAKALAAEYSKCQPKGAGVWGAVTMDERKLYTQKKVKTPKRVKAVSKA